MPPLDDIPQTHILTTLSLVIIILFWLHWAFIAVRGPSPVALSGGLLPVAAWLLTVVAPLAAELWAAGLRRGLRSCGARLSCPAACEIFLDQVSNPCSLH